MTFTTPIIIPASPVKIFPQDSILFVGSCFADNIGKRFADNGFRAMVNPFGVMYNPVSVLHTLEKMKCEGKMFNWVFVTLGTNHVYREKATGEIVDNCQKRPQKLFQEEVMSVEECVAVLEKCCEVCIESNPEVNIVFTVSPIRYKKYGYHESQLSKATLQLAVNQVITHYSLLKTHYFPAYEIVLDELRDYRFYAADMIHPSEQAVDYIFERFRETYFSTESNEFYTEYQPIKQALNHKPFNPDSPEYKDFLANAKMRQKEFQEKWNIIM